MRFRLIPRERSFFPLFEKAADNLLDAAGRLYDDLVQFNDLPNSHKEIVDCERLGDELTRELVRKLNQTYVTSFDREDIHALTQGLDDVVDDITGVSELLLLHNIVEPLPEMRDLALILVQAAEATANLMRKLENLRGLHDDLETIDRLESQADTINRRTVARSF